jgi:D-lactate dehydrogenase (cytochrome)
VPLHGILPHSNVSAFELAYKGFLAERAEPMKRLGVWTGGMYATVGPGGFLYEVAIYWPDEITDYHRAAVPADYLKQLPVYSANPEARAYADDVKRGVTALLVEHGAVNFQIGKAYGYADRLGAEPLSLIKAIKAKLDPKGLISPGNLGL